MENLRGAVEKTVNSVFADIKAYPKNKKIPLESLKANIGKVANIPLNEIQTDENIRKSIDTNSEGFLRLLESIKRYGVLENIVVQIRQNAAGKGYRLVCVAGHRRILAARIAKNIGKIPCLLQQYEDQGDSIGAALAENLNREDLHCLDVANGYKSLVRYGWSEQELASHYCRDKRTIRHYLKMAEWPHDVTRRLRENPSTFSTRVIMRQLAYKKFASTQDLNNCITEILSGSKNIKKTADKKRSKEASALDKATIKKSLKVYLQRQKYLSHVIKEEIEKAFIKLNLI